MAVPAVSFNVANPIALTASGVTVDFDFKNLDYTFLGTESIEATVSGNLLTIPDPNAPFDFITGFVPNLSASGELPINIITYPSYNYSAPILFEMSIPIQKGGTVVVRTFEMAIPDFKPSFLYKTKAAIKSSNASFGRKIPQNNVSRKQHPKF